MSPQVTLFLTLSVEHKAQVALTVILLELIIQPTSERTWFNRRLHFFD